MRLWCAVDKMSINVITCIHVPGLTGRLFNNQSSSFVFSPFFMMELGLMGPENLRSYDASL